MTLQGGFGINGPLQLSRHHAMTSYGLRTAAQHGHYLTVYWCKMSSLSSIPSPGLSGGGAM